MGGFLNTLMKGIAGAPAAQEGMQSAQNIILRMRYADMQRQQFERMQRQDEEQRQQHQFERTRQRMLDEAMTRNTQLDLLDRGARPMAPNERADAMIPKYDLSTTPRLPSEGGDLTRIVEGGGPYGGKLPEGYDARTFDFNGQKWIAPTREQRIVQTTAEEEAKQTARVMAGAILPTASMVKRFNLNPLQKIPIALFDNYIQSEGQILTREEMDRRAKEAQAAADARAEAARTDANSRNAANIASREKVAGMPARPGFGGDSAAAKKQAEQEMVDQLASQAVQDAAARGVYDLETVYRNVNEYYQDDPRFVKNRLKVMAAIANQIKLNKAAGFRKRRPSGGETGAGGSGTQAAPKVATQSQIQGYAKAKGISEQQAKKEFEASGFTVK